MTARPPGNAELPSTRRAETVAVDKLREQRLIAALAELQQMLGSGSERASEAVLERYPDLASDPDAALELIYTEHLAQIERGREVSLDQWQQRFPDWHAELGELFQVHQYIDRSTQVTNEGNSSAAETFHGWSQSHRLIDGQYLGEYELLELVGRGGMGVVYRARQVGIDRIVAVKTLHPTSVPSSELLRRFRSEADTIASLQHPNIVQLYGIGLHQGTPYFSMEYVAGGSLAAVIRVHPLPPDSAAALTFELANAMAYAHDRGVVHRDLKPANILLAPSHREHAIKLDVPDLESHAAQTRFEPKITDFGLAKRMYEDSSGTVSGTALGTPSYMAPEQATQGGVAAGPAADIYSLGAVLYDMLVGRPPFLAATPLETLERVKQGDPPSIRAVQPQVPRDLELICLKCLAKEPARRYSTAQALADDLRRFLEGRPILARAPSLWDRSLKWTQRHPALAALAATLILGSIGLAWQWMRAEQHRQRAEGQTVVADTARAKEQVARQRAESFLYARDVSLAHHELRSNNTDRALRLLENAPVAFRNWEWDYLKRACQSELRSFTGLERFVCCTALSRDGRLVAGGTSRWGENYPDKTMVWDVQSGRLLWTLGENAGSIMDLSFSPDCKFLAAATTRWQGMQPVGGLLIWSMETGRVVAELPNRSLFSVSYSPDGRWLAIGDSVGRVLLWDVAAEKCVKEIHSHSQLTLDLAWRFDSQAVASCSRDGTVKIHSTSGDLLHEISGLRDTRRVTWSADGRELATGSFYGLVRVFHLGTDGPLERSRHGFGNVLGALRFTPDGQSLVVSAQSTGIRLVDPLSGVVQRELHTHNGVVRDVEFDASGLLMATCGSDGNVKVFDLSHDEQSAATRLDGGHIIAAHFLDEQRLILGFGHNVDRPGIRFDGKAIRIWDVSTRKMVGHVGNHADWLTDVELDRSRQTLLSAGRDRFVRLWDVASGSELQSWGPLSANIQRVLWVGKPGMPVALTEDGQLHLGESVADQKWRAFSLQAAQPPVAIAGFHHHAQVAVATEDARIEIIDLESRESPPVSTIATPNEEIVQVLISPDDRWLAAGCRSGKLLLWELAASAEGYRIQEMTTNLAHTLPIETLTFSPDCTRLLTASTDASTRIWDLNSGQEVLSLAGPTTSICHLAVSPNFDRMVMTNRTLLLNWQRHEPAATSIAPAVSLEQRAQWHREQHDKAMTNNRYGAAVFHQDSLAAIASDRLPRLQDRVEALANLDRWEDVVSVLSALPVESRTVSTRSQLALLSLQLGRDSAYRECCRELFDGLSAAHNAREINSRIWPQALASDCGVSFAEVKPWVEKMVEQTPSPDHLNTAGVLFFRAGDLARARELLERALAGRTNSMKAFDQHFLAQVCRAQGDDTEAERHQQAATKWIRQQAMLYQAGRPTDSLYTWNIRLELELLTK
ncbi:MAG: protein kinase [Planctomycetaceae bacterium]|nr:protein kinase [Planctomycetaceae bacterium]